LQLTELKLNLKN